MPSKIIVECIILRNIELLKKVLNQKDYLGVFNALIKFVENILNEEPLEFKKTTKSIDQIINLFYELIHDYDEDISQLNQLVDNFNKNIKKRIQYLIDSDLINEEYHIYKYVFNRLHCFAVLTYKYEKEPQKNCEYDLLCYLIDDIQSYEYLELLIVKNPSILSIMKDNTYFFDYFLKKYLAKICNQNNYSKEDQEYFAFYQRTLKLLLENPSLKVSQETLTKIKLIVSKKDKLKNQETKNELAYIEENIKKHYPDYNYQNKVSIYKYFNQKILVPEYKKPKQVSIRLDLRKYDTISIDSSVEKITGERIIFDDAFTLFKNGTGYIIYIHLADAPCYVFSNESLNEELKNRMFCLRNGYNYVPLFEHEFAQKYLSLAPDVDRFAITIACEISEFGVIEGINFYESIIRNKHAFTSDEVNRSLAGEPNTYSQLLEEYAMVCESITHRQDNLGYEIPATFNYLAGRVVAEYFDLYKLPFIYRNCVPIKNITNEEQKRLFNDFLTQNISVSYLDNLIHYADASVKTFYDTTNYGHSGLKLKAYGEISSPIRSYVAIATLQGLKKMVFNKKRNEQIIDLYSKEFQELAMQANAIESVLQLK